MFTMNEVVNGTAPCSPLRFVAWGLRFELPTAKPRNRDPRIKYGYPRRECYGLSLVGQEAYDVALVRGKARWLQKNNGHRVVALVVAAKISKDSNGTGPSAEDDQSMIGHFYRALHGKKKPNTSVWGGASLSDVERAKKYDLP